MTHVDDEQPAARHERRRDEAMAAHWAAARVSARLSAARLVVGLSSIGLAVLALQSGAGAAWWLSGIAALVFPGLVVWHDRVERRARWHEAVATWHEHCLHRLARDWSALPPAWTPAVDPHHPFAHDLDLFGQASLFQLIGPPGTRAGREQLARWLLEPSSPVNLPGRQEAVRELSADAEFCERVAAHGRLVGQASAFDLGVFLEWAESPAWLLARTWMRVVVLVLAMATPLLIAAQAMGRVSGGWWLATATGGLALSWYVRHAMEVSLGRATGWEPAIRAYLDWLALMETQPFRSPYLLKWQEQLGRPPRWASSRIRRFRRIVSFAELRHTALLHFPIHTLTLWDFHVWWALERWQRDAGRDVRRWLAALGEMEGLVAFATLARDHPHWSQPVVDSTALAFDARAIGHPLLQAQVAVANDVRIGPAGRVLSVTGSNMSGKSTLLRAIGVNAVLAQAGAPVCAASLTMPPVAMHSSLRVVDSLAEGVSFFMAALAQLKRLVEAADEATRWTDRPVVLYLLDEILSGTNSVEREAAVRIVLGHLLATRSIGAITTHDLALTNTPELKASGDHVHFRETLARDPTGAAHMSFDYTLRPGVATSRNALALLGIVGLTARAPEG